MSGSTGKWVAVLAVVVIILAIIRAAAWYGAVEILTGAKPLRNVHPWDYIVMIITIIIVAVALAYAWRRWKR